MRGVTGCNHWTCQVSTGLTPDLYTERFVKRVGSPDATTGRARSAPDPYSESTANSLLMPSHTGCKNRV